MKRDFYNNDLRKGFYRFPISENSEMLEKGDPNIVNF